MRPGSATRFGRTYRATVADCRNCQLRVRCFSPNAKARTVLIVPGYEVLLRARRGHARWDAAARHWYRRHRWRVEGVHGKAKTQHGLRRAVRRGLTNVTIHVYLTAAVMNLKGLATFACALLLGFGATERFRSPGVNFSPDGDAWDMHMRCLRPTAPRAA